MEVKLSPAGGAVLTGSRITQPIKVPIPVHTCFLIIMCPQKLILKNIRTVFITIVQ